MNNLYKKGLLLLATCAIFVVGVFTVLAITSASLDGNIVVSPGDTVRYTIKISSDKMVTMYNTTLSYDSTILTLTAINNKDFIGTNVVTSKDLKFTSTGKTGGAAVAELVFKVNDTTSARSIDIELNPISVCEVAEALSEQPKDCAGGSIQSITAIKKSISIKSKINTLKGLKVNGTTVSGFASNKYSYTMDVEASVDEAKIEAVLSDTKASFQTDFGPRTEDLEYGENDFKVKVLSELGTEQVYTILINREDNRGTNNYLDSIVVNGNKVRNFKTKTLSYTVYTYKAETAKIEAETDDDKATYKVEGPEKLIIGENKFKVIVTSEAGEELIYNLNVNNVDREISKKLKTLSIKGYKIEFDKNTNRYEILYNKEAISKTEIIYQAEESEDFVKTSIKPDIKANPDERNKLRAGDEIVITVEGIDGEKQDYTIVLKKDKRISFFLILGLVIMAILVFILVKLQKNAKNDKIAGGKHTSKKDDKLEYEDKPKKKRFSIYEDEYEEVEVPVTTEEIEIPSGLEVTKEFSTRELRSKK